MIVQPGDLLLDLQVFTAHARASVAPPRIRRADGARARIYNMIIITVALVEMASDLSRWESIQPSRNGRPEAPPLYYYAIVTINLNFLIDIDYPVKDSRQTLWRKIIKRMPEDRGVRNRTTPPVAGIASRSNAGSMNASPGTPSHRLRTAGSSTALRTLPPSSAKREDARRTPPTEPGSGSQPAATLSASPRSSRRAGPGTAPRQARSPTASARPASRRSSRRRKGSRR